MHKTVEGCKWLQEQLVLRCEQMGIQDIPRLIFTTRDVLNMPVEQTEGRRVSAYKYLGVCYRDAKTILVNIRHKAIKRLNGGKFGTAEETLIHELVHYRFVHLNHGKEFNKRVRDIKHGKVWPMKNSTVSTGI